MPGNELPVGPLYSSGVDVSNRRLRNAEIAKHDERLGLKWLVCNQPNGRCDGESGTRRLEESTLALDRFDRGEIDQVLDSP